MPENSQNTLVIDNITIAYRSKSIPAVKDLSFTANGGHVLGILGGNGAGKTSTLKAVAGVLPTSSGRIFLNDRDYTSASGADKARSHLGYCADIGGLIKQATVMEHIALLRATHKELAFSAEEIDKLLVQMGLNGHTSVPVGGFSHGMARRLSVLMAFLAAKELLILDEPFDGVDPLGVEATMDLIAEAKNKGLVVIVSTHLLSLLTQASDFILVMNEGRMLELSDSASLVGDAGAQRYKGLLQQSLAS